MSQSVTAPKLQAKSSKLGYRPDLDGLRAISCLLVLFHHSHVVPGWPAWLTWSTWFQGWIGVDVFFVLSGFLITSLLVEEEEKYGRIHLVNFYIRREFRIVPAYYVAIAIYGLFTLSSMGAQFAREFHSQVVPWLLYLGKSAGSANETGLLDHAWSLRIEQRFYLVWPVLFFFLTKSKPKRLILLALAFVALLPWTGSTIAIQHTRDYYGLLEGCVVALLMKHSINSPFLDRQFTRIPTSLFLIPVALAFASISLHRNFVILFSFTIALFIYSLGMRDSSVKKALGWQPLVWLGQRSYSFYLLHMVVLRILIGLFPPATFVASFLVIVVAGIITAGGAAVMFVAVEEPMRKLGRRLTSAPRQKIAKEPIPASDSIG